MRRSKRIPALLSGAILLVGLTGPAMAERGEDVGIDLFLDTRGLFESGAGDPPQQAAPNLSEAPKKPRKPGEAPEGGTRWESDPFHLQTRESGDPRGFETDFRDSEFGKRLRDLF